MPKDKKLISQIPVCAFMSAQVIQELETMPSFQDSVQGIAFRNYGLPCWPFMNPAHVASLLYCLIVVSRHLFVGNEVQEAFWDQQVPATKMCSYFKIQKAEQSERQRSSRFLGRLRNSIAHVRFDMVNDRGLPRMHAASRIGDWDGVWFVFRLYFVTGRPGPILMISK